MVATKQGRKRAIDCHNAKSLEHAIAWSDRVTRFVAPILHYEFVIRKRGPPGVDYIFTELRIAINDARELCNVEPGVVIELIHLFRAQKPILASD